MSPVRHQQVESMDDLDEKRALRQHVAALEQENARLRGVETAARELLWAFTHTYMDPGPGSRIPTLQRAIDRLTTPDQEAP